MLFYTYLLNIENSFWKHRLPGDNPYEKAFLTVTHSKLWHVSVLFFQCNNDACDAFPNVWCLAWPSAWQLIFTLCFSDIPLRRPLATKRAFHITLQLFHKALQHLRHCHLCTLFNLVSQRWTKRISNNGRDTRELNLIGIEQSALREAGSLGKNLRYSMYYTHCI